MVSDRSTDLGERACGGFHLTELPPPSCSKWSSRQNASLSTLMHGTCTEVLAANQLLFLDLVKTSANKQNPAVDSQGRVLPVLGQGDFAPL